MLCCCVDLCSFCAWPGAVRPSVASTVKLLDEILIGIAWHFVSVIEMVVAALVGGVPSKYCKLMITYQNDRLCSSYAFAAAFQDASRWCRQFGWS